MNDNESMLLNGDLNQMSLQKRFLQGRGFSIGQTDVYPVVAGKDVVKALRVLWNERIAGWWNYHTKLVDYGICTNEEFKVALSQPRG